MHELAAYFDLLSTFNNQNAVAIDLAHNVFLVGAVLSRKPERVLELGVGSGYVTKSLLYALRYNRKGKLTSVDNWLDWKGAEPPFAAGLRAAGANIIVSGEEQFVRTAPDNAYDLLVSDADHLKSGTWLDQHLRIVPDGGFLFFHDTNQPRMFPGLAGIEGQVQKRGLPHFHFKDSSRPDERCQRGWLFVVNKKSPAHRAIDSDPVARVPEMHAVSENDRSILSRIRGLTMTSPERQIALLGAVRYLVHRGIGGCFVECGVWRGGSMMAVALALIQEGVTDRDLFLFDTFEGMTKPDGLDRTHDGILAQDLLNRDVARARHVWAVAGLAEVRENMLATGYPPERIHFVQGPVQATLPAQLPLTPIALLRLDTDWYESTKHELVHLFPLLHEAGVLIIDDYGHWQGARKAVDEYLASQPRHYYMHRIDYTGRLIVKH